MLSMVCVVIKCFLVDQKKKISKKGNNKREWIKLLITVQNLMVSRNFDDAQRREVKIQLIDTSLMYGLY